MQDLLVALTILTIFAVMWIVTFVASAIVLANRVHPNDKGNVERLRKSVWQLVTENLIAQPTPTAP